MGKTRRQRTVFVAEQHELRCRLTIRDGKRNSCRITHDTPETRGSVHILPFDFRQAPFPLYVRHMSTKHEISIIASHAQQRGCYIFGTTPTLQRALQRQVHAGRLLRIARNVYVQQSHWRSLTPPQRLHHLTLTTAVRHPSWTFAGLSAAVAYQLEVPWNLIQSPQIHIACTDHGFQRGILTGFYMKEIPQCRIASGLGPMDPNSHTQCAQYPAVGIFCDETMSCTTFQITSPARTIVDCGLRYEFRYVLPIIDSALRRNLTTIAEIIAVCDTMQVDCGPVMRLAHYANPLSENGGESLCRAIFIEYGLETPVLQHEFVDPSDPAKVARADFMWRTADGRIIVLEYDGMRKYVDPDMTNRRDIATVVSAQIERDGLLKRAGVDTVIHVTYDDVVQPDSMIMRLRRLGVPLARTALFDAVR